MRNALRSIGFLVIATVGTALIGGPSLVAQSPQSPQSPQGTQGAPIIDPLAEPPPFPSEAFVPPEWAPLPDDLDVVIIRQDEIPGQFRILDVTLNQEITEEEIAVLANLLKDSAEMPYQRTYIVYYLPGMEPGRGGWATSHFLPDLEVGFVDPNAELQQSTPGSLPGGRF